VGEILGNELVGNTTDIKSLITSEECISLYCDCWESTRGGLSFLDVVNCRGSNCNRSKRRHNSCDLHFGKGSEFE